MRSKGFDGMVCSIAGVMAVIGDRWGLLILRDLVLGLNRYEDFRQSSGVTNATLSDRLNHLEARGLIERRRYQVNPERFEYLLTQKGWQIASVMPVLAQIGDRCDVSGASAPPLKFVNRKTGANVEWSFIDKNTGEQLSASISQSKKAPVRTIWFAGGCPTLSVATSRRSMTASSRQAARRLCKRRSSGRARLAKVLKKSSRGG